MVSNLSDLTISLVKIYQKICRLAAMWTLTVLIPLHSKWKQWKKYHGKIHREFVYKVQRSGNSINIGRVIWRRKHYQLVVVGALGLMNEGQVTILSRSPIESWAASLKRSLEHLHPKVENPGKKKNMIISSPSLKLIFSWLDKYNYLTTGTVPVFMNCNRHQENKLAINFVFLSCYCVQLGYSWSREV